jgi:hypothetical protein
MICLLTGGCVVSINMPPKIAGLEAQHLYLFPKQSTEIKCNVSDPEGDSMTFKWSCTDGSFSGTGPVVTWTAPNKYGDFHIIATVEDDNGNSSQSTVTINIVVDENQEPCEACDR